MIEFLGPSHLREIWSKIATGLDHLYLSMSLIGQRRFVMGETGDDGMVHDELHGNTFAWCQ